MLAVDFMVRSARGSRMLAALMVVFRSIGLICGGHRAIVLENLALRQQLAVLTRTLKRPPLRSTDRLFWVPPRQELAGLSMDRLEALPDGRLRYWFKTPWRNGTTHAIFEPLEFIEKLCALVPTPRAHTVRYHGILGPAAKWRELIVPNNATTAAAPESENGFASSPASSGADPPDRSQQPNASPAAQRHPRNYLWSELMRRVFAADVLACDRCGGRLRILATIRPPETTRKILDHLGLPSRPPPLA